MKYWDEDVGRYIDCDVLWSGKGPIPGLSGEGFVQVYTGSYLTSSIEAEGRATKCLPTAREMKGKTDLDGLQIREAGWTSKTPTRRCACGRALTKSQIAHRISRCDRCRGQNRNMKRLRVA
jgi:hypothetical protein